MRTTMTEDVYGRCHYHMHLALTHVWNREDCIDVMVVTYAKNQTTFGLMEEITLTPAKVRQHLKSLKIEEIGVVSL